ncbi:MAG: hypothetical protein PHX79_03190 [Sphaerochaetaceae bacterium]|nr:hypothetical protein [Sphaerochaetaceae bacterium]
MNRITLLEQLRTLTSDVIGDIIMPIRMQKGDTEQSSRAADVYLMRLPDSTSAQKKAPYIIHQLITGKDIQLEGESETASAVIRSIFCVYNDNEEEGALMLVNLMERLRISLLKQIVVGDQFQLDLEAGLESIVYPDDTAPYYAGEMLSTWKLPAIQREVRTPWL